MTYADICREAANCLDEQEDINTEYYPMARGAHAFTNRLRSLADLLHTLETCQGSVDGKDMFDVIFALTSLLDS